MLVAPFFVAAALVVPKRKVHTAVFVGFILVLLGTVSLAVTVETGEAAAERVTQTPEVKTVLHHHEELAEGSEAIFGTLTVLFGALLFGPKLLRKTLTIRTFRTALSILLVAYLAGMLSLVNTAHTGGRLVHEFGVTTGQKAMSQTGPTSNSQRIKQASNVAQQ